MSYPGTGAYLQCYYNHHYYHYYPQQPSGEWQSKAPSPSGSGDAANQQLSRNEVSLLLYQCFLNLTEYREIIARDQRLAAGSSQPKESNFGNRLVGFCAELLELLGTSKISEELWKAKPLQTHGKTQEQENSLHTIQELVDVLNTAVIVFRESMKEQFNEEYSSFFNEEMHGPSDEEDGDCYQQLSRELLLQNLELCIQTLGSDELIAISERYSTEPLQSIMHETMRRTIYLCVLILKWVKYFVKNDQRKAANSTEARMKIMYDMSNYSYFLVWTKQNLVWNF